MKKRTVVSTVMALVLTAALAGCGSAQSGSTSASSDTAAEAGSSAGGQRTIGLAIYDQTNQSIAPEIKAVTDYIEAQGDQYVALDSSEDYTKLPDLVEQLTVQGVDGMIVVNVYPDSCAEALKKARDAGIPSVVIDCGFNDENEDIVVGQSVSDNVEAGKDIVNSYIEKYGNEGNVVTMGARVTVPAAERMDGLEEALAESDLTLVHHEELTDLSVEKSTASVENIIQTYGGDNIDAIFCSFGNTAIGAVAACQATGYTDIKVYGIDASADELQLVKQGMEEATVAQDFVLMGTSGAEKLYTAMNGEKVDSYYTVCPVTVVDSENVDEWISQK